MPDTIFIFLLALILFGPKKLPEIGREIGKFLAEFKRASNSFKSQIQSEMEKAGVDVGPMMQSGGQQTSSFAQTLLPPAVKSALSDIDNAHDRLMKTAKMAFDAQNYTARPEAPVYATSASEVPPALLPAEGDAPAAQTDALPAQTDALPAQTDALPAQAETPAAETGAAAAAHDASPAEAATVQLTPDPAPEKSTSALQSS